MESPSQKPNRKQENFLETLLKPVRYIDEMWLLRNYTKLGMKLGLDKGKKKYWIGEVLNPFLFVKLSTPSNRNLFGSTFDLLEWGILSLSDAWYNIDGLLGKFKEDDSSESKVLDPQKEIYKRYNSKVRLPTFGIGVGLLTKFGIGVANSIKNKTALEATSLYYLQDGLAHIALASSMYLKEIDPKILDKVPLWKKAWEYAKEKASLMGQAPAPVPVTNYSKNLEKLSQ
jgi:hypothetical protein